MIRFMALDKPGNLTRTRIWYYSWFTIFYAIATAVGMLSRVYLSNPAAFTHDLLPQRVEKCWLIKMTTVITTLLAILFALTSKETVFGLVILSWSGLASSFAPLLIIYALKKRPSQITALIMVIGGLAQRRLRWNAGDAYGASFLRCLQPHLSFKAADQFVIHKNPQGIYERIVI